MPKSGAFKGKVCWITGASGGIGESLAKALARQEAILVLSARREDELKRVAETCRSLGSPRAEVFRLDLLEFSSHKAAADLVVSRFGRIDYLINNAGRSMRALIENTELDVDKAVMEINFFGTISITKAALPHLLSQPEGGVIVNTSSTSGKVGTPCGATYSAAKHAVQGYFDSLRFELADRRIRVVNICPGPVESRLSSNAFSGSLSRAHGLSEDDGTRRIPADRCAAIMLAAMHAELPEAWLAPQPILTFMYVAQYARWLYFRLGSTAGPRRVAAFRAGHSGYAAVQSVWSLAAAAAAPPK